MINTLENKLNITQYHNDLVEIGINKKKNQIKRIRMKKTKIFFSMDNDMERNNDLKSFQLKTPKYDNNDMKIIETNENLDVKLKHYCNFDW